jgi:Fuc2NAc and GlcNAc transferase
MRDLLPVAIGAFIVSALLTRLVRNLAVSRGVLDVPNQRSSHSVPTPRGGGLAIVVAATLGFMWLAVTGTLDRALLLSLLGGVLVAMIGLIDDRLHLPARVRLPVHFAAALWALVCLGGLAPIRVGNEIISLGASGYVLGVLGIVWALNLFNFMDGIDGIAASEAIFVVCAGALSTLIEAGPASVPIAGLVLGAACAGFLLWNWPPAKIFMGDVGSGYIGYVVAVMALAALRHDPVALWTWLILGGLFFVDATVTLVRRFAAGERIHEAHRSHAYQHLARRWGSHKRVTCAVWLVNVLWLLPCALAATIYPTHAAWITAGALTPIVVLVAVAGAGRRERPAITQAG